MLKILTNGPANLESASSVSTKMDVSYTVVSQTMLIFLALYIVVESRFYGRYMQGNLNFKYAIYTIDFIAFTELCLV